MEEKIYHTTAFSIDEKDITKKSLLNKLEALMDEFTGCELLSNFVSLTSETTDTIPTKGLIRYNNRTKRNMKVTEETRKFWEERSAAILDAYQKGLISIEDPLYKEQIEWAKETTAEKEAALKGCDGIIDRWQAETDAMSSDDTEE